MDVDRVEADLANSVDLLFLHLNRLEQAAQTLPKPEKERLAKTANIFYARVCGLVKQANRVSVLYPKMT